MKGTSFLLVAGGLALVVSTADAQVLVRACVPGYASVVPGGTLEVINSRRQTPPSVFPTPVPAGMQSYSYALPDTIGHNAICGTDAATGYVEFTAPSLGGPGIAVALTGFTLSPDGIASSPSNLKLEAALPLAAPSLK